MFEILIQCHHLCQSQRHFLQVNPLLPGLKLLETLYRRFRDNSANTDISLSTINKRKIYQGELSRIQIVSARNVFRYLYSIFMFAAFLSIFVFAPLVLLFGSLVFHCPRSFVLRVRIFLHIVYLAFIVMFRVSSSFSCAWPVYSLMFGFLLVLVFRPYLAIVFTAILRYTSLYFAILRYTSHRFTCFPAPVVEVLE